MNKEEQIDIAIEAIKQEMIGYVEASNIGVKTNNLTSCQLACGCRNSLRLLGCEVFFEYDRHVTRASYVKSIEIDGIKTMMGEPEESCKEKKEEIKL